LTTPVGPIPYVHPGDSLGSLAAVTGRSFGVAVAAQQLALGRFATTTPGITGGAPDPSYAPKVMGEFNSVVAASMYYFLTETGQGDYMFGDGDAILAGARANGLPAHCHHLIGPTSTFPLGWRTGHLRRTNSLRS